MNRTRLLSASRRRTGRAASALGAKIGPLAAAVGMTVLLLAVPPEASARPEELSEEDLDALTLDELESELMAIECELAAVQRERFLLAMSIDDVRGAGLALAAWRSHQRMARTLALRDAGDPQLSARVASHARALAFEGRLPLGLDADVDALGRELDELAERSG